MGNSTAVIYTTGPLTVSSTTALSSSFAPSGIPVLQSARGAEVKTLTIKSGFLISPSQTPGMLQNLFLILLHCLSN